MKKTWIKIFASLTIILMLFSLAGASAAEAWWWGGGGNNNPSNKNPVVFVHGYLDKDMVVKSNFDDMISYLDNQGWNSHELHAIQYSNVVGCNINNAYELQSFINNLGYNEVDIVAHSMGGLSTRYYMQNLGGHNNVGSVVTLGTPHDGVVMANLAPGAGADQMRPSSNFLNNLNSGNIPPGWGTDYTSIYSYSDPVVPWYRSRPDGWNNIGGWFGLHIGMLSNSSAMWHVQNNLTQ